MAACELTERAGARLQLSTCNLQRLPSPGCGCAAMRSLAVPPKTKFLLRVGFRICLAR